MPEENRVYVQLTGRMGNHLFQFATGYRAALDRGAELVLFDPLDAAGSPAGLGRVLARPFRFAGPRDMLRFGRLLFDLPLQATLDGLYSRARAPGLLRGDRRAVVREEDFGPTYHFHPEVLEFGPPVLLTGFFQNEEYFASRAEELLAALRLPPVSHLLAGDLAEPLMAVVFRRGDYVDRHWALPLRYYDRALARLAELASEGTLLVFSDDVEFAELAHDRLSGRLPAVSVPTLSADPVEHLALLQQCDHHILANSSFSWWGAWLAEYGSPGREHHLLIPKGWISDDDTLAPARWERITY